MCSPHVGVHSLLPCRHTGREVRLSWAGPGVPWLEQRHVPTSWIVLEGLKTPSGLVEPGKPALFQRGEPTGDRLRWCLMGSETRKQKRGVRSLCSQ